MSQTKAKWEARVASWRDSGQSAETFTHGQGYAASTLRYWASRLRCESARSKRDALPAATPPPRAIRMLRVTPTAAATSSSSPLMVRVGGAVIPLHAGFDHALLREVVDVLGAPQ